jgi:hypothetical protein
MHMLPITAKGMEGKRATARRERGQEGKAHRQMKRLYCVILNIHIRTHKCFQNNVFSGSPSLDLLILSLYVCIYAYKVIHHTHTDIHTFSIYVCLSYRERGGIPSLSRCVYVVWVGGNRTGEDSCGVSWNSWCHSVEPICQTPPKQKGFHEI